MNTEHVPLREGVLSVEGIGRGKGRERGVMTRTDETRKWKLWNEGPSGEVEGFHSIPSLNSFSS